MNISTGIENWFVDDMTPRQVRHVKPVLPADANGQVADIYGQIRRDFQLVPPLTLFSPSTELLAGVWSVWRESQFARGSTSRSTLEAVSVAISSLNNCPYCVDAHSGMLHATSKHDVVNAIFEQNNALINDDKVRKIVEWALATKTPGEDILKSPPFSSTEAPEIIGTAIIYHFINRMVNLFLESSPLPIPSRSLKLRRIAVRFFGATLAKQIMKRQVMPGDSLKFITPSERPEDMAWAVANNNISAAYASFSALIERLGKRSLPAPVRQMIMRRIQSWQGEDFGLSRDWVNKLLFDINEADKPAAKLALLTAFAPYQVDDDVINQYRSKQSDDAALLEVTAWASFSVARHIGSWMH